MGMGAGAIAGVVVVVLVLVVIVAVLVTFLGSAFFYVKKRTKVIHPNNHLRSYFTSEFH